MSFDSLECIEMIVKIGIEDEVRDILKLGSKGLRKQLEEIP